MVYQRDESQNQPLLGSTPPLSTLETSSSSGSRTGIKREREYDSIEASPSDEPESSYQHTPATKRKKLCEEKHHGTTGTKGKVVERENSAQCSTSTLFSTALSTSTAPSISSISVDSTPSVDVPLHEEVYEQLLVQENLKFEQWQQICSGLPLSFRNKDRCILGEWILDVSTALHIQKVTTQIAYKLFQRYLFLVPTLPKRNYQLVCLCCLIIAIKFEEIDCPSIEKLNQYTGNIYTDTQITMCELEVLNTLGWQVQEITPTHFLNYLMEHASTRHALHAQEIQLKFNELIYGSTSLEESELHGTILKLAHVCIDHCFAQISIEEKYLPSEIAMASIACARKRMKIADYLPSSLLGTNPAVRLELVHECVQTFECHFNYLVQQMQNPSSTSEHSNQV